MAEIEDLTLRQSRELRREQREIAGSVRELFDFVRQQGARTDSKLIDLERSILQAREEIELTVKIEVGGRMAGFASRAEARIEEALSAQTLGTITADDKPD